MTPDCGEVYTTCGTLLQRHRSEPQDRHKHSALGERVPSAVLAWTLGVMAGNPSGNLT